MDTKQRLQTARQHLVQGNLIAASECYQLILTQDKQNQQALSGMGYVLMYQGYIGLARLYFRKAGAPFSASHGALCKSAVLSTVNPRLLRTIQILTIGLSDSIDVRISTFYNLLTTTDISSAANIVNTIAEHDNFVLIALKGLYHYKKNQREQAEQSFEQSIKLAGEPLIKATLYHLLGSMFEGWDESANALKYFKAAYDTAPKANLFLLDMIRVAKQKTQLDFAVQCADRMLANDPAHGNADIEKGYIWILRGNFSEAEDCFTKAITKFNNKVQFDIRISLAYQGRLFCKRLKDMSEGKPPAAWEDEASVKQSFEAANPIKLNLGVIIGLKHIYYGERNLAEQNFCSAVSDNLPQEEQITHLQCILIGLYELRDFALISAYAAKLLAIDSANPIGLLYASLARLAQTDQAQDTTFEPFFNYLKLSPDYQFTASLLAPVVTSYFSYCLQQKLNPCITQYPLENILKHIEENTFTGHYLLLSFYEINDENLQAIISALNQNQSVRRIELRGNNITDKGAGPLLDFFRQNPRIIEIKLSSNPISKEILAMFEQQNSNRSFLQAIKLGNQQHVKHWLETNPELIQAEDEDGRNALYLALEYKHFDLIPLLQAKNIDMYHTSKSGNTIVHMAAQVGYQAFVKTTESELAEPNKEGQTPIHFAAMAGQIDVLRLLSEYDLDAADNNGRNVLHYACMHGQTQLVQLLINELNCDLNETDKDGNTPLHLAIKHGQTQLVQAMLAKWSEYYQDVDLNAKNHKGETLLHIAAANGQDEIIKLLEEHEVDLEILDLAGNTPLLTAILSSHQNSLKVVKLLAETFKVGFDQSAIERSPTSNQALKRILTNEMKKRARLANTRPAAIKNLVFQGGSIKGIAYLGALKLLYDKEESKKNHNISLTDVERVGGASAGAITALVVALNFTLDEMQQIMRDIKFLDLLDTEHAEVKNLVLKLKDKFKQEASWADIKSYIGSLGFAKDISWNVLSEFYQNAGAASKIITILTEKRGLFKGDALLNKLKDILQQRCGDSNITFEQLHASKKRKGYKDLYCVGVNINTGASQIFSHEHTPNMPIATAIRISMAIPFVFVPYNYEGNTYIDGGVQDNFPIWLFDRAKYISERNRRGKERHVFNEETLGFRLVPLERKQQYEQTQATTMTSVNPDHTATNSENAMEFFLNVFKCFYNKQESDHQHSVDSKRTVYIHDSGIGLLDFNLNSDAIANLMAQGEKGLRDYYKRLKVYQAKNKSQHAQADKKIDKLTQPLQKEGKTETSPVMTRIPQSTGDDQLLEELDDIENNRTIPKFVYKFFESGDEDLINMLSDEHICSADKDGKTVLHYAVENNNIDVLTKVINKDIGLKLLKKIGENILDLALLKNENNSHKCVIDKLLMLGLKPKKQKNKLASYNRSNRTTVSMFNRSSQPSTPTTTTTTSTNDEQREEYDMMKTM